MSMPRMRTIPAAFQEIKAADPNTALTMRGLRAAVNRGEIPSYCVGSKRLVNVDQIEQMLCNLSGVPKLRSDMIRPL